MKIVTRGYDVMFLDQITDASGLAITQAKVTLTVSFWAAGVRTTETQNMIARSDGTWQAVWFSGAADAGLVQWAVRASGAANAADEGAFMLAANAANQ